ncbi:hypothetical protein CC86DRAFT_289349 [Ophiobolus disseminans]|uniref:C6 zinc finger domain-containing protein n=1 Tax=Ophiobolus disseminans TaxID=1469910 RepID=A0A6A7A3Z7_9PLEO|nr:hypothetical protein CC86DRAFT_289349 [Ophiobolus disseminans]
MTTVLKHFANETVKTVSPGKEAQAAWREALPSLATQYPFVLHGVLAVACLHVSITPGMESEKDIYQDIAATQMNLGMAQYHIEVQKVTTTNAEALFAFSVMVTTFVLFTTAAECRKTLASFDGTETSTEQRTETISTMANLICRTFRSMRGVLVILVPCYHHIRSGKLEAMLERDWWPAPIVVTAEDIDTDKRLRQLEMMWCHPGKTYEYSFDALRCALKDLRENFAVVSRLAEVKFPGDGPNEHTFDWTAVLHWPIQLSLDYISLLDQRRMEAWVLMAHYAMLPARATSNPWLDGFATNIVTTAALVIGEENWEWIAWPATVLTVDLERLRIVDTISQDSDI